MWWFVVLITLTGVTALGAEQVNVERYDYVIGTQTFGPRYRFTDRPALIETAEAILAMGSDTIKFRLGAADAGHSKPDPSLSIAEYLRTDAVTRHVLDMPFVNYLVWAYLPSVDRRGRESPLPSLQEIDALNYADTYELAKYLLETYSGTGKRFFIGHWEGDWLLRHIKPEHKPTADEVARMLAWTSARQRAIEAARREVKHHNVEIYNYVEVNLVRRAIAGEVTVTNDIVPQVNPDYVSYSSYDMQQTEADLTRALDYIESKLSPRPEIAGKRVFIGEYGFPLKSHTPAEQDRKSRQVMRVALRWGCRFCLYWEMYNNEVYDGSKDAGYALIDEHGNQLPVYKTHQRLYEQARLHVSAFARQNGRLPTAEEFAEMAMKWLQDPDATAK